MPTTDKELRDALAGLIDASASRAATLLGEMAEQPIELCVPSIRVCGAGNIRPSLLEQLGQPDTFVSQPFDGPICGQASLCFTEASGLTLARILSRRAEQAAMELDAESRGILLEVGNIVLNGALGALAQVLPDAVRYALPELQSVARRGARLLPDSERGAAILGEVRFGVAQHELPASLLIVFTADSMRSLQEAVLQPMSV